MRKEDHRRPHDRQSKEERRHSDRYKLTQVGYCTVDEKGFIRRANPAITSLLGVPEGALTGKRLIRYILPQDRKLYRHLKRTAKETDGPAACRMHLVRQQDGEAFRVGAELFFRHEKEGRAPFYRFIVSKEYHLQEAEERHLFLFQTMKKGVLLLDRSGRITEANPAAESILRISREALEGQELNNLLGGWISEQRNGFSSTGAPVMRALMAGESIFGASLNFYSPQRKEHVRIILDATPLFSEEITTRGAIVVFDDVTEQSRADELIRIQREELSHLSRLATAGEMASSLTHELNQPLTSILNNAEAALRFLALHPPDIDEVRDSLKDIADDAKRAGLVIHHLRKFLTRQEVHKTALQINELIQETLILVQSEIHDCGISVTLDLSPALPHVLVGKTELQQVLMNLVLNACDAMAAVEPKRRQLTIRTVFAGADRIMTTVQDRGCGLDVEETERLFTPFFTTKKEGLGMGLSLSRRIITSHGGRLWAENNPDQGAAFYFTLPVCLNEGP